MTTNSKQKPTPTVVVAGSTGFIGTALAAHLDDQFHLVGLTRSDRTSIPNYAEVRQTDLFSSGDAEKGLKGADYAIYLVHSMMPSARLVQASFRDLDLLCADNFAKAAAKQNVKHIIYVGGIQPEDSDK
ncbi:MAG: NmrA family protein, partial [Deltaproteobacteria bacterium]|nr:NmrA family protein [Deltaproteobacteria bacterium]